MRLTRQELLFLLSIIDLHVIVADQNERFEDAAVLRDIAAKLRHHLDEAPVALVLHR
jgi:hypothetical protein